MKKYIDADKLLLAIEEPDGDSFYAKGAHDEWDIWRDAVRGIPEAYVRPIVSAKWEAVQIDAVDELEYPPTAVAAMFCPVCKHWHNEVYFSRDPTEGVNYCPRCGATMNGRVSQHGFAVTAKGED